MLHHASTDGYTIVLPGVRVKTLTYGERTLLSEFRFDQGAVVPAHRHPHEQTGCVVRGALRFTIDGAVAVARAGDAWNIPAEVLHAAEALEDSVVVEVFSPLREDYLAFAPR